MTVLGADALRRKLSKLDDKIMKHVAKANQASGEELIRIAKVLVHSPNGKSRAAIKGTANADGSYFCDFGPLSKVLEGGRKDAIADPGGENIGTTAARPFVNPALQVTRKKHSARAKRAMKKGVKEAMGG